MSKHTPGPWEVSDKSAVLGGIYYLVIISPSTRWVAHVMEGVEASMEDARLIAAAPDLLEMLKVARKCLQRCHYVGPERETIDAAILKATGEA